MIDKLIFTVYNSSTVLWHRILTHLQDKPLYWRRTSRMLDGLEAMPFPAWWIEQKEDKYKGERAEGEENKKGLRRSRLTVRESPAAATTLMSPGLSSWTVNIHRRNLWRCTICHSLKIYPAYQNETYKCEPTLYSPDVGVELDGLRSSQGISVPVNWADRAQSEANGRCTAQLSPPFASWQYSLGGGEGRYRCDGTKESFPLSSGRGAP